MKNFILSALILTSSSAFACDDYVYCSVRMNDRLAISVATRLDDFMSGKSFKARFNFDDINHCTRTEEGGWMCTEIAAPDFDATFLDVTPSKTVGSVRYKISRLDILEPTQPLPSEAAQNFTSGAVFTALVLPYVNLFVSIGEDEYEMKCVTSGIR